MLSQLKSCGLLGVNGVIITVEIDISRGLPTYSLVGLPDIGIKESKDRVFSAIKNNGYKYPMERITINLAPADLKKEGPAFDLAIALGILNASEQLNWDHPEDYLIIGELSLSGEIRSVNGVLPMVLAAKEAGIKHILVPFDNRYEAAVVQDVDVIPLKDFNEATAFLKNELIIEPFKVDLRSILTLEKSSHAIDFSDIRGQDLAKRALEIAAAGSHNVLMSGPPGSGKTMLAKGFSSILPDLTIDEALEITKIHSISGLLKNNAIMNQRPFRSPHHTISKTSLVGGGRIPKPGEVSLAHLGVLFLDELPEFQKSALEVLRQPMEDQEVTISRVNASLTFPASFTLITSMNPCPCGYLTDPVHECLCTPQQIKNYQGKISGPLMDRLDIFIEIPSISYDELQIKPKGESSQTIKKRVDAARERQNKRYQDLDIFYNAQLTPKLLEIFCQLGAAEKNLMEKVYTKMKLSARGYHRILKLARTIADLDDADTISVTHLSEAIQYRGMTKQF
ncbi:YifB family Mg chelatase-like AAA ATPase [Acetobacterium woodii]|uniref:ComM competence protein M n=1 Tax=Acetobacterium woodii (strain ATCC 29683 / DSM 1030 / JCM 2381 / KCTC 1655 / WB1) TaxID=931626 RepID=H6LEK3_ACEWD|nr:YifB family Mg chelatase-like AAA ATPase [Acetobacterium woodii]AFA48106.1 comM competence protein M [Acetobacterium woodii DSM 1030]